MRAYCNRVKSLSAAPSGLRHLLGDDRGDAAVEYIALIGTIAIPAIAAFVAVGKAIVNHYTTLQNILLMPLP